MSNLINFIKTKSETDNKELIEIIKNYYYNNDLPTVNQQNKLKTWFKLDGIIDIEKFLENITDNEYDNMIEMMNIKNEIGSVPHHKKCNLEKFMGSLDKIKNENDYLSWKLKHNKDEIVVTEKLDGISALLTIKKSGKKIEIKLCTRGNGKIGCDISHLVKYLNLNLNNISDNTTVNIRGELIIPINKDDNNFNLRNIVSGLVHTKEITTEIKEKLKYVKFVAYRLYDFMVDYKTQIKTLQNLNFETPQIKILSNPSFQTLKDLLNEFVINSKFQIDGIVISHNDIYGDDRIDKNPDHSIALKNTSKSLETEIVEIEWNVSKHGVLKPRIKVNPVNINGVNIEWVTGFNARYIVENQIGSGTIIEIERSGDVIPNIKKVIKSTKADLPKNINWIWNKTNVDICIDQEQNDEMEIKRISTFFQELECPNLGPKTIETLYNFGIKDICSFLKLNKSDLINTGKYKDKSSENILKGLQICKENLYKVDKNNKHVLFYASGCFGFGIGSKKIKLILDQYPNIISDYNKKYREEWVNNIQNIKGIFEQAESFIDNIHKYKVFYDSIKNFINEIKINENCDNVYHVKDLQKISLLSENITFTGFRDNNLKKILEENGNIVNDNITKSTTLVIYKDNLESSKCIKAKNMGIKLMDVQDIINLIKN